MYIKNKRGQSTVEYILLVTAVIAVMIVFATSQQSGGLQSQLCSTLNTFATAINDESGAYDQSHISPAGGNGTPPYSVGVNPNGG